MKKLISMFPVMALIAIVSSWLTRRALDEDEVLERYAQLRRSHRPSSRPMGREQGARTRPHEDEPEPADFREVPESRLSKRRADLATRAAPPKPAPEPEPQASVDTELAAMSGDWTPVYEAALHHRGPVAPPDQPELRPLNAFEEPASATAGETLERAAIEERERDMAAPAEPEPVTLAEEPAPQSMMEAPQPESALAYEESQPDRFTPFEELEAEAVTPVQEPEPESLAAYEEREPELVAAVADPFAALDEPEPEPPTVAEESRPERLVISEEPKAEAVAPIEEPESATYGEPELLTVAEKPAPEATVDSPQLQSAPVHEESQPERFTTSEELQAETVSDLDEPQWEPVATHEEPEPGILRTLEEPQIEPAAERASAGPLDESLFLDDPWAGPARAVPAPAIPAWPEYRAEPPASTEEMDSSPEPSRVAPAAFDLPAPQPEVEVSDDDVWGTADEGSSVTETASAQPERQEIGGHAPGTDQFLAAGEDLEPGPESLEPDIEEVWGEEPADILLAAQGPLKDVTRPPDDSGGSGNLDAASPALDGSEDEPQPVPGLDLKFRRTWKRSRFADEWDPVLRDTEAAADEAPERGPEATDSSVSGVIPTDPTTFFDGPTGYERPAERTRRFDIAKLEVGEPAQPAEDQTSEDTGATGSLFDLQQLQDATAGPGEETPTEDQGEADPFALDSTWEPEPGLPEGEEAVASAESALADWKDGDEAGGETAAPAPALGNQNMEPAHDWAPSPAPPEIEEERDAEGPISQGIAGLWARYTAAAFERSEGVAVPEPTEHAAVSSEKPADISMPSAAEPPEELQNAYDEAGWGNDADSVADPGAGGGQAGEEAGTQEPEAATEEGTARSFIDEGNAFYEIEAFELAEHRYARAIAAAPEMVDAYYNRANARVRLGDLEGALSDFNRAIDLSPDDPDALNNRGMLYLSAADADRALRDFEQAAARRADDPTILVNLGVALTEVRRFTEALRTFERAAVLDPRDAAARYGAARAAARLSETDRALVHVREALALDPSFREEMAKDPMLESLQKVEAFGRLLKV